MGKISVKQVKSAIKKPEVQKKNFGGAWFKKIESSCRA